MVDRTAALRFRTLQERHYADEHSRDRQDNAHNLCRRQVAFGGAEFLSDTDSGPGAEIEARVWGRLMNCVFSGLSHWARIGWRQGRGVFRHGSLVWPIL